MTWSLLEPGGRPLTIVPYALAYAAAGSSGQLVVAIKYEDYVWALDALGFSLFSALAIIAAGHLVWRLFGRSFTTPAGIALAIIVGSFASVILDLYLMLDVLGYGPHAGKPYVYQLTVVRGPLLGGDYAAAYYYLKLAEAHGGGAGDDRAEQLRRARRSAPQAPQAQVEPFPLQHAREREVALSPRSGLAGACSIASWTTCTRRRRVRQATTALEQELRLAQAYLDIQQLRIGGRLAFSIDVPDRSRA
jgi:hypothetical protein